MTLSAGTKLGRYEIRSKLGAGGMGEVYLATDTKLGRDVALKILPSEVANDRNRMGRFVREAKATSALNHPNILTIYEIDQTDSVHFISSELVQGLTLRERLNRGQLSLSEIIEVGIQIANGLVAAHGAGLIHRDLKPENIMLRDDGLAKIVDFGIAKLTGNNSDVVDTEAPTTFKTSPGAVMGTPFYMSPEQLREQELDARTDLFSFGVVLYEMVAGRLPFSGSVASEVMASIISANEVQPLTRYSPDVPSELERIVLKALRKNRDERYQTAKDLWLDLKTLRERLTFEREIDRAGTPIARDGRLPFETIQQPDARSTLGVSYLNTKAVSIFAIAILLTGGIIALYWYVSRSGPTRINSVAVLPFVNASRNADLEYLSDGMTDSLINNLSQLPNLSVKGRSSVFRYKGVDIDPQKLASDLSVQAILSGRVVQHGDDLTLYLSLVDGRNGNQIWGEQYNRKLSDLVSLQTDIAREVSRKLQARLSGTDEQRLTRNYTSDSEAYQLYLKGRYHTLKGSRADLLTAIAHFQKAVEIDPSYALAYVGLADAYRSPAIEIAPTEVLPKAKAAALKAVELDEGLSDAHAVLGWVNFWYDWDFTAAENQFKRALVLDPRNADARSYYANLLSNTGRHREALAEAKLARELDPLNLRINALEGQFLVYADQVDAGLERLKKTLELDPNYFLAHNFAANAYIAKRMFPDAIEEARQAIKIAPTNSNSIALLGYGLALDGRGAEARELVDQMIKARGERYVSAGHIAVVFHALGDREQTLNWLERAFAEHDSWLIFLKADPKWNSLRSDPKFQELVRRVGLPE